jgi:hypothetical protein
MPFMKDEDKEGGGQGRGEEEDGEDMLKHSNRHERERSSPTRFNQIMISGNC